MLRYSLLRLLIGLMFFLLASCATIIEKTTIEPTGWLEQRQRRLQIDAWEIRGRLGVQTQTTGGSVDLIWKQSGEDYSIRLILPLGSGNYLIQGNAQFAEIRYPNGQKKVVNNLDDVFSSTLGVSLPVSAIKDWVRGLPAKSLSTESRRWNEQGLLNNISQSGWNVGLSNYAGNEILLPHAVYLSRDDNAELDVRLLLRQWLIDS